MTRDPSTDPARPSKRKGTRSVSTLTPAQLARKRANDREAQRAIRARTKEHIERLEREIEEFKNKQNRDDVIRGLREKCEMLQREVARLQQEIYSSRTYLAAGMSQPSASDYALPLLTTPGQPFDVDVPASAHALPGRPGTFGHPSPEYGQAPGPFPASYLPTPEPCDQWPVVGPVSSISVVSSPCSSASHPEDFGYIPTSAPSGLMDSTVMPPTSMPCLDSNTKVEYEDIDPGTTARRNEPRSLRDWANANEMLPQAADQGYTNPNVPQSSPTYMQPSTWPVYQTPTYYPQAAGL
ncbi:hypothetical protein QBC35DRAFT_448784 [Podospora australis]|uniref:BZIP domain-containing protein n=1 Tax=Podospora australis TaxID=1536484 RepID=A0AAN7AM46_9PEZI|nr:hypothetical protein QBC35DRAFT_448784 [Podospora australis]